MIRKLLIILTLLLAVSGCGSKAELPDEFSVYVLVNEQKDDAVIVISDLQGKTVYQSDEIIFPGDVYYGADGVYYSGDNVHYSSLDYSTLKKGEDVETVSGRLAYYGKGHIRCEYDATDMLFYKGDELLYTAALEDVQVLYGFNDRLYVLNGNDGLTVYDAVSGDVVSTIQSPFSSQLEFAGITEVDGRLFLISENGYTEITEEGKWGQTFVFSIDVQDVEGARGGYLAVITEGEEAYYRVSFDRYSMKMEEVYDDYFTSNRDFEKIFSQLYGKGYTVWYGQEYLK